MDRREPLHDVNGGGHITMASFDHLPPGVVPIAVPRDAAAALLSISPNHFTSLVDSGLMPQPRTLGRRVLWDADEVKAAWRALPKQGEEPPPNSWADLDGRR